MRREEGEGIPKVKERGVWVSKGPKGDGAIYWHLSLVGHQPTGPRGPLEAGH